LGGEGLKGAIRRTFSDEFDIGIFPFASRIAHLFPLDSVFILRRNILRNIGRGILSRKPANTSNGILVRQVYTINSGTYDNIVFLVGVTKMKNSGVIELTA